MSPKKLLAFEKRKVGLLASGAYVRSSYPEAELERIAAEDLSTVQWNPCPQLITIRSQGRGVQVRFGYVSTQGDWLRYPVFPPSFGHVDVFQADVGDISIVITSLLSSKELLHVVGKPGAKTTLKAGTGYLLGPAGLNHNTLLCADRVGLHLVPFELDPPDHSPHELGTVRTATEDEAKLGRTSLDEAVRRLGKLGRVTNTAMEFASS